MSRLCFQNAFLCLSYNFWPDHVISCFFNVKLFSGIVLIKSLPLWAIHRDYNSNAFLVPKWTSRQILLLNIGSWTQFSTQHCRHISRDTYVVTRRCHLHILYHLFLFCLQNTHCGYKLFTSFFCSVQYLSYYLLFIPPNCILFQFHETLIWGIGSLGHLLFVRYQE